MENARRFVTLDEEEEDEGVSVSRKDEQTNISSKSNTPESDALEDIQVFVPESNQGDIHEPISILGKSRRTSGESCGSSSVGSRHSVKFSEIDEHFPAHENIPENVRKITDAYRFRVRNDVYKFASTVSSSEEISCASAPPGPCSEMFSSSYHDENESFRHRITRTQDKNRLIASMELKVPSILSPNSPAGSSMGCSSPMLGMPNRSLMILSPHNPPPDLQFSSNFTVRTRKGKTIVLPKLRIPTFPGNDPFFLG